MTLLVSRFGSKLMANNYDPLKTLAGSMLSGFNAIRDVEGRFYFRCRIMKEEIRQQAGYFANIINQMQFQKLFCCKKLGKHFLPCYNKTFSCFLILNYKKITRYFKCPQFQQNSRRNRHAQTLIFPANYSAHVLSTLTKSSQAYFRVLSHNSRRCT